MKLLLAPNSFKECADSVKIAGLLKQYLDFYFNSSIKSNNIVFLEKPISDGGDGFLNVCKNVFNIEFKSFDITYPSGNSSFKCEYGIKGSTVFIESAKVLGMNLIPHKFRHPLYLNSAGLGDLLSGIMNEDNNSAEKISKVVIGIGGTGTNDFAIGLCSRFGLKLLDKNDNVLDPFPVNFIKTSKILRETFTYNIEIDVVLDVTNPLLGENGASRVFGPQKGAAPEEIEILEEGLTNITRILQEQDLNFNLNDLYGAGGGLSGGLHYFLNANYVFAEKFIKNVIGINKTVIDADCIITGEGCFDAQSANNKGSVLILNEFLETNKPVFICAGKVKDDHKFKDRKNLYFIELSRYFNSIEDSVKNIEKGIQAACKEILEICKVNHYIS